MELARSTDDFNGAMLKAVCVEAGMQALRRGGTFLVHEDYVEGIAQVQSKKKSTLNYYAWWLKLDYLNDIMKNWNYKEVI